MYKIVSGLIRSEAVDRNYLQICDNKCTMIQQVWQMVAAPLCGGEESPGFIGQDAG